MVGLRADGCRSCDAGAFGIGTSLSNDFRKTSSGGREKSRALNMVIKLSSVDGKPTVKISDEITKVNRLSHSHMSAIALM